MSSSSANRRELDSVAPDDISTELALWKHLIFSPNMAPPQQNPDDEPRQDNTRPQIPPPYFQAPPTMPPQLPPETYTYLIHALLSLQGSAYHPPSSPQLTPPSYHYPWPPGTALSVPSASVAGPSSFYPTNPPLPFPPHLVQSTNSSLPTPSVAASPTTASTVQDPEGTEDATSTAEDKRRRNTAASARFRVKKKMRTLNLERTVADLTGRTEELEREASDLRRENAWLKEIVLLKGRNLATLNLGLPAPGPSNQHDEDDEDDRTQTKSQVESIAKSGEKGKDKEN